MAGPVDLHAPGPLTLTAYTLGGRGPAPEVVGGNVNPWDDDSDSTYAELETFEHPDVSYADAAYGSLESVPLGHNPDNLVVTAQVRYQSLAVDMTPPRVYISNDATLPTQRFPYTAEPTGPGSMTPTWQNIPMVMRPGPTGGTGAQNLIDWMNAGVPLTLIVAAPFLRTYVSRYVRTRVFEARVVVTNPRFYAPPCRNIKRGDALDLGGARNYPPSKMQQTSSRGVGAY